MASADKSVNIIVGAANYNVEYGFPATQSEAQTLFPYSNRGKSCAWHHAFLSADGNAIIEWGDDNHSNFGWNAIRRIPLPAGFGVDQRQTDFTSPGTTTSCFVPSNANPYRMQHYNNHIEIYHPLEQWWSWSLSARVDLSVTPGVLTHRPPNDTGCTIDENGNSVLYNIPGVWSGPTVPDNWIVNQSSYNGVYNAAVDYSYTHDKWFLLSGGAQSDSALDAQWLLERNPAYPSSANQPWRMVNFAVTGKTAANYQPFIQSRFSGRFRQGTDWFYQFGGQTRWVSPGPVLEFKTTSQRINIVTGEMQQIATMPCCMSRHAVVYLPAFDKFLITGIAYNGPLATDGVQSTNHLLIYDPVTDTYQDITPPGFRPGVHVIGIDVHPATGKIFFRNAAGFYPALPGNQSENWKLHVYWWVRITLV